MRAELIFLPVVLQVLMTIGLYFKLASAKKIASQNGEVDEQRRGLYDDAWPASVQKINNSIRNQFEIPVLFYVLSIVLWALNSVTLTVHVLAWVFFISRVVHMVIHTGSNFVPARRGVFIAGVVILIVLALLTLLSLFTVTLAG